MGNFIDKFREIKSRRDELAPPINTDDDASPKLIKSRKWQVMDSTFQWKLSLVLCAALPLLASMLTTVVVASATEVAAKVPCLAAMADTTKNISDANNLDETEAFFRREKEARVPIIMYHLVTENSRYIGKYGISPADLRSDLQFLKDNNYNTVVIQDLINFVEDGKALPPNPIVLTFDDGNASDYKFLLPLLKEYDMKAVVSIIGKTTNEMTSKQAENPTAVYPNLTWSQVQELHNSGHIEVQSHGYDVHGRAGSGKLMRESASTYHQRLKTDLQKLQDLCQQHLNYRPTTFCYPYGIISKGSHAVLTELGFAVSLSCQEGINTIVYGDASCLLKLNRVNRASGRPVSAILDALQKKK